MDLKLKHSTKSDLPKVDDFIVRCIEDAILYDNKCYLPSRVRYMSSLVGLWRWYDEKLVTVIDQHHQFLSSSSSSSVCGDLHRECNMLSLVQISSARELISKIRKDYFTQIKKADSIDSCKSLKLEAMGCMCTVAKLIIGPCLDYLGHMSKLGDGAVSEDDMKHVKEMLVESTRRRCVAAAQDDELVHADPNFLIRLGEVERDPSLWPDPLKWNELVCGGHNPTM